ncbi:MAG: hypothetical protein ACI9TV_001907 [Sulfurimonas sp.]|uniref:hypothetical protein n=1 Tax=Sulfurimonas sp. TaxID=2022749 RepID=UPI0039E41F91
MIYKTTNLLVDLNSNYKIKFENAYILLIETAKELSGEDAYFRVPLLSSRGVVLNEREQIISILSYCGILHIPNKEIEESCIIIVS